MRFPCLLPLLAAQLSWAGPAPHLERLEGQVASDWAVVNASGYDYARILQKSKAGADPRWLARADQAQTAMQRSYDALVQAELDALMDDAEKILLEIVNDPAVGAKEDRLAKRLLWMANDFRDKKRLYGTPKDVIRKNAYAGFFRGFRDLNEILLRKPLGVRLREKIRALLAKLREFSGPLREVPALLKTLYLSKDRRPLVIGNILDFASAYKRGNGFTVDIAGRDRIPPVARKGKVVNVYAPSHRLPLHDLVIMSELAPRDTLLFMAPRNFLPGPLADQLAGKPGLLAVTKKGGKPKPGGPGESIREALRQLASTGTRNIYIYPEGGVPAGLMENQPNKENFGKGLIPALREAGYEVNVIPVTHANAARFMNEATNEPGAKALRAAVHEPIPDSVLAQWEKYDPAFLNRYLRSVYLTNIETDATHLMGLVRPAEARRQLRRYLGTCSERYSRIGSR